MRCNISRDLTKNASNLLEIGTNAIGPLLHGASVISLHCWVWIDTLDSGFLDNCVFCTGIGGSGDRAFWLNADGANFRWRAGGCSQTSDAFLQASSPDFSFVGSAWSSVGVVWNIAGDKIRIYIDGTQQVDASTSFTGSAYTHTTAVGSTDRIGAFCDASPSTAGQTDGRIAELALWTVDIGPAGFASLAAGFAPTLIAPWNSLAVYLPMIGQYSPEIDLRNGKSGTITGSVPAAAHPRILYPKRNMTATPGSAAPTYAYPVIRSAQASINQRIFRTPVIGGAV